MKIDKLTNGGFEDFFEFNKRIYPRRKDVVKRFKFQFLGNPLLENKSSPDILVAYNSNNEIVGQFGIMPFNCHVGNKILKCFCGCDSFVLEEYRKKGVGGFLKLKAIKEFKPYFAMGSSEESRKLLSAIKAKEVGNLYKNVWFRSMPCLINSVLDYALKKNKQKEENFEGKEFQKSLIYKKQVFKRVDDFSDLKQWKEHNWGDQILMASRSSEFLTWRFLNKKEYCLYVLESDPSTYFAMKRTRWLGMNLLTLVDYRVPFKDKKKFKSIISISKKLAQRMKYDGILTMSSHKFFDVELRKNFFIKFGKPHDVVTNILEKFPEKKIMEREFMYMTMADSDLEF